MSGETKATHTETPWREWRLNGEDEYPPPGKDDVRLVGSNDICVGIIFGGYPDECNANPSFICLAVNSYASDQVLIRELVAALKESKLQLEYLAGKFQPTGTGAAVVAKIDAALAKVESSK